MSPSLSGAAIIFDNVVFRYGATEVLHGLSFLVNKGELVGLLGPNGAGKSTCLKIISGILTPSEGSVRVNGLRLPDQAIEVKKQLGYVPEVAVLFESLTGQEFMELMGRLHDVPEQVLQFRIAEILETFNLTSDRSGRLDSYSKGMRQKVLIGAALLHNPDLILLDEPLSGLDVNAAVMVKDLLSALAAAGKTILYSSHVLDVVEKICDRVLIIDNGNLIADGASEVLKKQTDEPTLEAVFRKLTGSAATTPKVDRIISALQS